MVIKKRFKEQALWFASHHYWWNIEDVTWFAVSYSFKIQVFGSVKNEPFTGISVISVSDFFQQSPAEGRSGNGEFKSNEQNFETFKKLVKTFEWTEVMQQ